MLVDADGLTLGRLASFIAHRLRGKHRPDFTPHVAMGDRVVVINAAGIRVSGNKAETKTYHRHSGYPGGLKSLSFRHMMEKSPEKVLRRSVRGMLPRTPLGRTMLRRLSIYDGGAHPHAAQSPRPIPVQ